jgi:serine/threonine-protein kinase RsbW
MSFGATALEARGAIAAISKRLRVSGLSCERANEVEIALAEAINNVVEHAYTGVESGKISVKCNLANTRLLIRICDTGVTLPQSCVVPGFAPEISVSRANLPEGGFGWFLVHELASNIRYERRKQVNHLILRFDLHPKNTG